MQVLRDISLTDFDFWSGAKTNAEMLTQDELETLEGILESEYAMQEHIPTETEINDLMWFEFESICQWLGIEYDHKTGDVIREALHSGKALTGIKLHESFKKALANRGVALKESKVAQGKESVIENKKQPKRIIKEGVTRPYSKKSDEEADYVIVVFADKNRQGEHVMNSNPRDAFDVMTFDTPEEAQAYADKNYPDAELIVVREEYYQGDVSGAYSERENGVWKGVKNEGCKKRTTKKSKKLTESVKEEDRIKALANYLEVEPETITVQDTLGNLFEIEDGEVYFVGDEEESYEAARQDIESVFDDLGLESFTPNFVDWILDNAVESGWFEDWLNEDSEYLWNDMDDSEKMEALDGYNIEYDENADLDDYLDQYVEERANNIGDAKEYYKDAFGLDEFSRAVRENDLIDMDAVVAECISEDGIAHFVARYDGVELDLGNGLYAYRVD